ncbi:hypothetical protein D3C80_1272460 [compost metagenome]
MDLGGRQQHFVALALRLAGHQVERRRVGAGEVVATALQQPGQALFGRETAYHGGAAQRCIDVAVEQHVLPGLLAEHQQRLAQRLCRDVQ